VFRIFARRNSISHLRQHPDDFIDAGDTKLADEFNKITDTINTIEAEASAGVEIATLCSREASPHARHGNAARLPPVTSLTPPISLRQA
jgi:hypothetical protein